MVFLLYILPDLIWDESVGVKLNETNFFGGIGGKYSD